MILRLIALAAALLLATTAYAQRRDTTPIAPAAEAPAEEAQPADDDAQPAAADPNSKMQWRTPGAARSADGTLRPISSSAPRQPIARVTDGPDTLPADAGQKWRDYDITPYTTRVTSTNRPEQAILDWVLRETGYEAWHGETLSVLSVDRARLRVYHTPEMHAIVQEMVDRFVNTEAESQAFGMRVITVGSPNWRIKSHRVLHPIAVQTQGTQAWLLAKEDAALLVADLRRRNGFQEHSTPHLLVNNGQSRQISATRARNYMRDLILKPEAWPGFEPQTAVFDEGFKLDFSPLLSIDGRVVDAVVRCEVDQVEKMIPVMLDVPTAVAPRQRQRIDVPQPISSRLHERFRWPVEQVLLISLGMGPSPVPPSTVNSLVSNVPLMSAGSRSELLVFIESKGKAVVPATALQPGQPVANKYHDRY